MKITNLFYGNITRSFLMTLLFFAVNVGCQTIDEGTQKGEKDVTDIDKDETIPPKENQELEASTYKLPNIDLNHWKVTIPIGNPTEVAPPAILNYATNTMLKPFFYNDSINGALVFYAYPESSTANSSYSRTELREQLIPGSNNTNWTFGQGGSMKGTLSIDAISKDVTGKYHKTIVMQIHGILTNEQRNLIGQKDNNAPPMLKIYWQDGKVRVKTKILKDLNANDTDILKTDSWGDDAGYNFKKHVGFEKFTLEVKVSNGKMEVILNDEESIVYNNIHIQKWGIFENYFKAGNYLGTTDEGAYARVKYYELEVSH